jgi:hypothetical protein
MCTYSDACIVDEASEEVGTTKNPVSPLQCRSHYLAGQTKTKAGQIKWKNLGFHELMQTAVIGKKKKIRTSREK